MTRRAGAAGPAGSGDHVVLQAVLELAVIVAQAGLRSKPPFEPPSALRRYLGFTHRVPPPALRAARTVLDDDPDYRSRVRLVATEELVGPAGMAFLDREVGWEDVIGTAAEAIAGPRRVPEGDDEGSGMKRAERRLAGTQDALRISELARSELARSLAREEEGRAALERDVRAARGEVAELQSAIAKERTLRAEAEAGLARALRDASERRDEAAELTERLAAAEGELQARDDVERAVRAAVAAVADVHASLLLWRDGHPPRLAAEASPGGRTVGDATTPTLSKAERHRRRDASSVKRPVLRAPGHLLDESVEAAMYFLRVRGVLVIVDGYNVAKWRWPGPVPAEQLRDRLVAVLGDVAARTGAAFHVVFDGQGSVTRAGKGPVGVSVSFSAAAQEADDLMLEFVAAATPDQPLVVVSSDRRVRDSVRARGATPLGTPAFVATWSSAGLLG